MSFQDPTWRSAVESAVEFLTLVDAEDRLIYVNHAEGSDYVGASILDFISPAYHDRVRSAMAEARTTGYPQHYESEALGVDGGVSFYSNWILPLSAHGPGEVLAFVATDVTSLRQMEDDLARSAMTFRSVMEHAPDPIMIVDCDHRISFANHLEYGHEMDGVLGRRAEEFVAPDERELVAAEIDAVVQTGERRSYETTVTAPDGDFVFSTRAGPILVDGQVEGVVLIATDITKRLEAERERERLNAQLQQSQKMEALGQLTGGVSHDFNNLLTVISGNLDLLHDEFEPGTPAASHLSEARRAVDQAAHLTRRLLVFARHHPLVARVEQVEVLIDAMAPLLERTLGETIDIRIEVADELWPCRVDRGQLEQALLNLAVNARDAMPSGGTLGIEATNVVLEHGPTEHMHGGEYVAITVSDTGVGMNPEVVGQAFEPFFTTKEPERGTGLGLAMVYGFVSQSGGHVELTSRPGDGTDVRILLPHSGETPVEQADNGPREVVRGSGDVVLVVEDQPMVREVCGLVLHQLGYRAREVDNAQAALAALDDADDLALVLTDFGLPGDTNGIELARRVAKMDPPLPVILMSGYADPAETGADFPDGVKFLQKPFQMAELAEAVAEALREPPALRGR